MYRAWTRNRAQLAVDRIHHFAAHLGGALGGRNARRVLDDGEGDGDLSLDRIGHTDHRDFRDPGMRLHRLLDFARSHAVPGDVDDIVGAAQHKVVAVRVAGGPVESRVHLPAGNRGEIRRHETLVVAPDGRHAPRR